MSSLLTAAAARRRCVRIIVFDLGREGGGVMCEEYCNEQNWGREEKTMPRAQRTAQHAVPSVSRIIPLLLSFI